MERRCGNGGGSVSVRIWVERWVTLKGAGCERRLKDLRGSGVNGRRLVDR